LSGRPLTAAFQIGAHPGIKESHYGLGVLGEIPMRANEIASTGQYASHDTRAGASYRANEDRSRDVIKANKLGQVINPGIIEGHRCFIGLRQAG
jgi:hypothetical protein